MQNGSETENQWPRGQLRAITMVWVCHKKYCLVFSDYECGKGCSKIVLRTFRLQDR